MVRVLTHHNPEQDTVSFHNRKQYCADGCFAQAGFLQRQSAGNHRREKLSKLDINADAGVVSFCPLRAPKILVAINGYCDLHLKSTGKIFVRAEEGYSLKYLNQPSKDFVIDLSAETEN